MDRWYDRKNSNFSKQAAAFGTDPFGAGELTDKVTDNFCYDDTHSGVFEASEHGKHSPNDIFSEQRENETVEKKLDELKKLRKKRNQYRLKIKPKKIKEKLDEGSRPEKKSGKQVWYREAQWGSMGPVLPTFNDDDWLVKTYQKVKGFEDAADQKQIPPGRRLKKKKKKNLRASSYEIMKRIYGMEIEDKRFIHDCFDEIMMVISDPEENQNPVLEKYRAGTLSIDFVKTANLYDPETPEQMLKLIGLIHKFIDVDQDLSYDNLCVFLYPLGRGAKKILLRPARLIGITKELWSLCRRFDRFMQSRGMVPEESERLDFDGPGLVKRFRERLKILQDRINQLIDQEKEKISKPSEPGPETLEDLLTLDTDQNLIQNEPSSVSAVS